MKKEYKKPVVILESFALTTSIAGDCEVKANTPTNNTCGWDFSGLKVFMTGMSGCADIQVPSKEDFGGDGDYNGICYHVPYGDNLFNS